MNLHKRSRLFRQHSGFQAPFLILLLSIGLFSSAAAQGLSPEEEKWLSEEVLPPSTNLMFQMNVSRSLLRINEKRDVKPKTELPNTVEELNAYIAEHPFEVKAYKKRFQMMIVSDDHQAALAGLQKGLDEYLSAMEVHPDSFELVLRAHEFFYLVGARDQVINLTRVFLEKNPRNAEAHAFLAMQMGLLGDLDKSREHVGLAYAADPLLEDVYVSEWMFQWMQGMLKANEDEEMELATELKFLEKAQREHPDLRAPNIVMHTLVVTQALIQGVLIHQDDFVEQNAFQFNLPASTIERVDVALAYFRKLLKKKAKNPYFIQKCLALGYVLKADMKAANKIYEAARKTGPQDTDIYRIMTIAAVTEADFLKAAAYTKESFAINPSQENLLLYARLLSDGGQPHAAVEAIRNAENGVGLPMDMALVAYLVKSGDWAGADKLMERCTGGYAEPYESNYRYISAIMELRSGDRELTKAYLIPMKENGHYEESIARILKHFELE